jgi:hypothetical protein
MPFDIPLGERKTVSCRDFGSYLQMLPAWSYLPDGSLQNLVKVMSLNYTIPSGLAATPSVSLHPPSKTRSSLAPEGGTLGSPLGAGNPGSAANAAPAAMRRPSTVEAALPTRAPLTVDRCRVRAATR